MGCLIDPLLCAVLYEGLLISPSDWQRMESLLPPTHVPISVLHSADISMEGSSHLPCPSLLTVAKHHTSALPLTGASPLAGDFSVTPSPPLSHARSLALCELFGQKWRLSRD